MSTDGINNKSSLKKRSLENNEKAENKRNKIEEKQSTYSGSFFTSTNNQDYIQQIILHSDKNPCVQMMPYFKQDSTLYARRQGTLVNQLLEVARQSQENAGGAFEFIIRTADFFCYDLSSEHSEDVCIDSHHIHMYVDDINIQAHAKFYENKELIYVRFTFKELLNFNDKKEKYNFNKRLVTLPEDLRQILSWLKESFSAAIRNDKSYFELCDE